MKSQNQSQVFFFREFQDERRNISEPSLGKRLVNGADFSRTAKGTYNAGPRDSPTILSRHSFKVRSRRSRSSPPRIRTPSPPGGSRRSTTSGSGTPASPRRPTTSGIASSRRCAVMSPKGARSRSTKSSHPTSHSGELGHYRGIPSTVGSTPQSWTSPNRRHRQNPCGSSTSTTPRRRRWE